MLIKVTNRCDMGCWHCSEDSKPSGALMSRETFLEALRLTERVEGLASSLGIPPFVMLSGGEPTQHPELPEFIEAVMQKGFLPTLVTNGMWLADPALRAALLRPEWSNLFVQVTNDPQFYPKVPPRIDDKRITYVDRLSRFTTIGRAATIKRPHDIPPREAPCSFNLRSMTRHFGSIERAVAMLRARATTGFSGFCTPSITVDGRVVAGEWSGCFEIGTVTSSNEELTEQLLTMKCGRCGLVERLTPEQKRAIGEVP